MRESQEIPSSPPVESHCPSDEAIRDSEVKQTYVVSMGELDDEIEEGEGFGFDTDFLDKPGYHSQTSLQNRSYPESLEPASLHIIECKEIVDAQPNEYVDVDEET